MPTQEFDLASAVCDNLGSRAAQNGLQSLSEPERAVLLVWWAQGIIANDGFEYFYEGACNMADVAEAFQELGFSEAAQACRQSMTLFPPELLGSGAEKCFAWMTQFDAAYIEEFFASLSPVIWATDDDDKLSHAVIQYVGAHRSAFSEVR